MEILEQERKLLSAEHTLGKQVCSRYGHPRRAGALGSQGNQGGVTSLDSPPSLQWHWGQSQKWTAQQRQEPDRSSQHCTGQVRKSQRGKLHYETVSTAFRGGTFISPGGQHVPVIIGNREDGGNVGPTSMLSKCLSLFSSWWPNTSACRQGHRSAALMGSLNHPTPKTLPLYI